MILNWTCAGERPFHCRLCGNSFTTNGNMHRHMKTHQNEAGIDLLMGSDKKRRRRGGSSARSGSPTDSQSLANSQTQSMLQGGLLVASEPRDSVADTGLEEDESESCARLSVDSASVGRKTALVASEDAPADVPPTASSSSSVPALLPPPREPPTPTDEWQSLSITRTQSRVSNAFSISVLTSNTDSTPTVSSSAAIAAVPVAPASIASSSKSRSTLSSKRSQRVVRAAALKQRLAAVAAAADAASKDKDTTRASTPCSIDMKFRRNAAPVATVAPVATPPPVAPLTSTSAIAPVLTSPASESGALAKSETLDVKPNAASNEDILKLLTAMLASSQQQSSQQAAGMAASAASAQQQQLSSVLSLLQTLPVQSLLASAFVNAISMNLVGLITNASATSATSPTSLSSVPTLSTATAAAPESSRPALASCNTDGDLKCAALDEEQRSPLDADADEAELKQSDEELKSDLKPESAGGRKRERAADNSIHPCKICGEQFATLNAMRGTQHWLLHS